MEKLANANSPANRAAPASSALSTQGSANNFQIQELVVRFSAVSETLQSGDPKNGGTTVNFSAFNPQVEAISLTCTNGSGKTVQLEAPESSNSSINVPNDSANAQTKAASA